MKDRALQLASKAPPGQQRNVLREYLQAHVLYSLQSVRAFEQIAFVGGTALRFLYGLHRYSEDLDFSLEHAEGYSFDRLLDRVESDLTNAGFDVTMHSHEGEPIHSAFVRLPGLLYEAGLSPHRTEKLSVKIEIDTRPPAGATVTTTLIDRHFLLALLHYDIPSMMAGKLHALLSRPYTKGRDIYDLLWYLSRPDGADPNIHLLQNALAQTGWNGPPVRAGNWREAIADKIAELDFSKIAEDVGPFLERPEDRALLSREIVLSALRQA
ncbi:nucleotidyl transferase AbiEii/AbiGii toxin family protein [Candidatus Bipolaricaulota bacterium]|jgi:predicted nucleotidyltransferase component of viral defense system|nr:nucleotidyl transferase AbiEii/AbiGii toxin family protein [Candidatus Bipolaricaulota bacterium]